MWEDVELAAGANPVVVRLPVMARSERVAEKVATFLNRGSDRDAYDLYYYDTLRGEKSLTTADWSELGSLVSDKIELDRDFIVGEDLHERWKAKVVQASNGFGEKGDLIVSGEAPPWADVSPHVHKFRQYVPATKVGRTVSPRK